MSCQFAIVGGRVQLVNAGIDMEVQRALSARGALQGDGFRIPHASLAGGSLRSARKLMKKATSRVASFISFLAERGESVQKIKFV